MDTRDLEYVIAIARTGSFSQAASQLFISQPALSQYIKRLENQLNITLFHRSRTHVELTQAGAYYVKEGEQILNRMKELEQAMQKWQQQEIHTLSIGVSQFYGKWFLTPFLQTIQQKFATYHIQIVDGESRSLEVQMLQDKLDFGIFPAPIYHEGLQFLPIKQEEILFAINEENQKALDLVPAALEHGRLNLLPFKVFPFVLAKDGLKLHKLALKICKGAGFKPQSVYSSENPGTVYSLINHNYGIGFVPDVIARDCDPRTNHVKFWPLKSRYNHRTIGLTFKKNSHAQELAPKLMEAFQTVK